MKGLPLFFEAFKSQVQNKLDAIVAVVHFMMIDADFVCVGIGDEVCTIFHNALSLSDFILIFYKLFDFLQFTQSDAAGGSEILPSGWNSNPNAYSLKYRSRSDSLKVLLKGIVVGELFIVSAAVSLFQVLV